MQSVNENNFQLCYAANFKRILEEKEKIMNEQNLILRVFISILSWAGGQIPNYFCIYSVKIA